MSSPFSTRPFLACDRAGILRDSNDGRNHLEPNRQTYPFSRPMPHVAVPVRNDAPNEMTNGG